MIFEIPITIRPATPTDVALVSQCVLASVDMYDFKSDSIEKNIALDVCGRDDTLYSWRNARVAEIDGEAVGCIVAYDGSIYREGRRVTFGIFAEAGRPMDDSEPESGPGEFYIDSIAIKPEFRGRGIGLELLKDALETARAKSFVKVSLLVENSKPRLQKYYAGLGFKPERELFAFGEKYTKMILCVCPA